MMDVITISIQFINLGVFIRQHVRNLYTIVRRLVALLDEYVLCVRDVIVSLLARELCARFECTTLIHDKWHRNANPTQICSRICL